jgi:hypothetical protein
MKLTDLMEWLRFALTAMSVLTMLLLLGAPFFSDKFFEGHSGLSIMWLGIVISWALPLHIWWLIGDYRKLVKD